MPALANRRYEAFAQAGASGALRDYARLQAELAVQQERDQKKLESDFNSFRSANIKETDPISPLLAAVSGPRGTPVGASKEPGGSLQGASGLPQTSLPGASRLPGASPECAPLPRYMSHQAPRLARSA